jgi:hypothetical protein
MPKGRLLSAEQLGIIEAAYRAGKGTVQAAREAGCSEQSARNKYGRFRRQGIPCAERVRTKRGPVEPALPKYTGPAVIGRAITAPTPPVGPGWIG